MAAALAGTPEAWRAESARASFDEGQRAMRASLAQMLHRDLSEWQMEMV
jgi:hypothetical protein